MIFFILNQVTNIVYALEVSEDEKSSDDRADIKTRRKLLRDISEGGVGEQWGWKTWIELLEKSASCIKLVLIGF